MSSVVISGDISGSVTLDAPSVAGTTVLTLPATSGTVLTQNPSAPANSLVVDASGNVGIGTASIGYNSKLNVKGTGSATAPTNINGLAGASILIESSQANTGFGGLTYNDSGGGGAAVIFGRGTSYDTQILFYTNPSATAVAGAMTERMRIDSNGNVLVGTTSSLSGSRINLVNGADPYPLILRTSGAAAGKFWFVGPNASNNFVVFNQSATTGVFITDGGTSWTASSDETLKTDLKPIENAAEKVSTLRAVTGRYKTDEENISRAFLIAQDVQKVLPEAVSVSTEGTLGLAYTETIPLLVAAIKEQQTIINDLKARVEALENK